MPTDFVPAFVQISALQNETFAIARLDDLTAERTQLDATLTQCNARRAMSNEEESYELLFEAPPMDWHFQQSIFRFTCTSRPEAIDPFDLFAVPIGTNRA
ncbi:MAG: DUF6916 family protein, partial [Casimicrobium sp.]